ncbi:hypothetical protein OK349_18485 [Sphingomonas sp. BT-65]|uniref:hypothetical protein n=1 Tax=Sphingomonas sp. BT-65 TaxID=2989821 RepID=UPI002236763C|nr:hypothetical protein [Sphingomonas sp. BT-65]MCW4463698.1 hypothetical protein [Sphingomonas sp. BT-65]
MLAAMSPGASAMRRVQEPTIGPVCLYGLVSLAEEIGKNCPKLHDARVQTILSANVQKLDAYFARGGWTAAQIAEFKREQAHVGAPDPKGLFCKGEMASFYPDSKDETEGLAIVTDHIVSKPRPLEWGDCI